MNEIASNILVIVATVGIPAVIAILGIAIKRIASNIKESTDNEFLQAVMDEVSNAVTVAVACTNQLYVDKQKSAGTFDQDAQTEAFQRSLETAIDVLSDSAKEYLQTAFGSLNAYLTTLIEAEVRVQKLQSAA